ncbi:hypothetical protein C1646_748835 [Rhizophagus diaphanus]|nr:hypothetical protein C1646_748835 [Rhizophagus diaphanus] [Rhizophagus sp. MUCL 43196]
MVSKEIGYRIIYIDSISSNIKNFGIVFGKALNFATENWCRLAHVDPDIVHILQDDAKDSADDGSYIAIFVSSEEVVPKITMNISEEESMNYLIEKYKIDEEIAKELYQLKTVTNDIKKQKLIEIEKKLSSANLLKR